MSTSIRWFSETSAADVPLVGGQYLVELGIDAMSVTPDTLLKITRDVLAVEARLGRPPRPAGSG